MAEKASTKAIEIDATLRWAFQIRGEARFLQKKFKAAAGDFHKYKELDRLGRKCAFCAPSLTVWKRGGAE